jgi:hypothetical protein
MLKKNDKINNNYILYFFKFAPYLLDKNVSFCWLL